VTNGVTKDSELNGSRNFRKLNCCKLHTYYFDLFMSLLGVLILHMSKHSLPSFVL